MPQRIMRSCAMKARLKAVNIAKLPELLRKSDRVGFNPASSSARAGPGKGNAGFLLRVVLYAGTEGRHSDENCNCHSRRYFARGHSGSG